MRKLSDLLAGLDVLFVVHGDANRRVHTPAPLDACPPGGLTWAATSDRLRAALAAGLREATVVCPEAIPAPHLSLLVTEDPRLGFAMLVNACWDHAGLGIHPRATIYDCVVLGERVTIGAGAVIGGPGFGYVRRKDGRLVPFPQIGRVVLGDDVRIGANTCVDRGSLGDTVLEAGVKVDNMVHIAHGVHVGRNTSMAAGAEVSGSVHIGQDCQIGPNACIREGLTIGDGATIGIGAVVVRNVPAGAIVAGNPAEDLAHLRAQRAAIRRLAAG